jgi:hypothetical protein
VNFGLEQLLSVGTEQPKETDAMDGAESTRIVLMYFVMPLWLAAASRTIFATARATSRPPPV